MKKMIKIAIAGLGTVGSSVINYLEKNNNYLSKNINNQIKIVGICASNIKKSRSFDINKYVWFDDPVDMIKKTSPNIFIELIGTEKGISYDSIKYAIEHNVHVISANKALIANYGNELFPLAEKNNINFLFEASVAGGIPVIKIIKESLLGNNITKISGILNGSTNYILSNMTNNECMGRTQRKSWFAQRIDLGHGKSWKIFGKQLTSTSRVERPGSSQVANKKPPFGDRRSSITASFGSDRLNPSMACAGASVLGPFRSSITSDF